MDFTACHPPLLLHQGDTKHVSSPHTRLFLLLITAAQVIVLSLITGSLFYQLPTDMPGARSFFGFAFLLVLMANFGGFPQLPITIEAKK
jgi:hypothetical protein